VVVHNRTDGRRRYVRIRNLNVVHSAVSVAPVLAIDCCVLRRNKFRFGHAVQAIQGSLLDVEVLADHVCGDAYVTQSQYQRIRQRQPTERPLALAEVIGHPSSMRIFSWCRVSMAILQSSPELSARRHRRCHSIRALLLGISAASSSRLVVPVFDMAR
jgi:hypothetical protein